MSLFNEGKRELVNKVQNLYTKTNKNLQELAKDALDHPEKFFPGEWAEIVRQAAIVGATGLAKREHPRDAALTLAKEAHAITSQGPTFTEDTPMEHVMRAEYASAIIEVLGELPTDEEDDDE